jgi:hypothetical protein
MISRIIVLSLKASAPEGLRDPGKLPAAKKGQQPPDPHYFK